jgi:ribosome-associated protein
MEASDNLRVNDDLVVPTAELTWRFTPSGGPGGQHANTSNTRAEVVFDITDSAVLTASQRAILTGRFGSQVSVAVDETRSQTRNRQLALERLAARLAEALRPRRSRRATKPTRGAKERRLKDKRQRSQRKADRRQRFDSND